MVGRADAVSQLGDLLEAVSSGSGEGPGIGLISGEAGIGKSRLIREVVNASASLKVLAAGAEPTELGLPYAFIRRLLAGGGGLSHDPASDPGLAVFAVLDALGVGAGLIVVEDLHWVDAESVVIIDRLAQLSRSDLGILASYRPEDLSRRLPGGELLLRLERRHAVDHVHLDRLSRAEVGLLLASIFGSPPSTRAIQAIYGRTGGNPFIIEELARCCGDTCPDDLATVALPWSLDEAVRSQLDGLSSAERRLIETAAVCGPSSSFDLLAAVAGLDEVELLDVLRALVARDLLVELSDDQFGFRHALVRDAVAGQLLGRERRQLHHRACDALATSADTRARARHAAGAGRFELFLELARTGSVEALQSGLSFEALRLADEALAEAPDDEVLLEVAAEASWLVGAYDETRTFADRWLAGAKRSDDLAGEAGALRWLARIAFEQGDSAAADVFVARLTELVDVLESGVDRARALAAVAQMHMLHHRPQIAIEVAQRAIVEADAVGAHAIAAQARIEMASARGMVRDLDPAIAVDELLRAVDAAEALGEWTLVARGLNNLFDLIPLHSPLGRELIERFRRAARRAGYDWMSTALSALREVELAVGEGDQPVLRQALAHAAEWWRDGHRKASWHRMLQFDLALEEGRFVQARALLDSLEPDIVGSDAGGCAAHGGDRNRAVSWLIGKQLQLAVLSGTPINPALPGQIPERGDHRDVWILREMIDLVGTLHEGGCATAAIHAVIDNLLGGPEAEVSPGRGLIEPTVRALIACGEGRHAEAVLRLRPLVADPDPSLPRHYVGHLRVLLATSLLAEGSRADALAEVNTALDTDLARWPGWRRDRAEALRRRMVVREVSQGELTAREREVAILLAEGLTNSQLARRLYISPKTAAVHVSNILMKLRMSSRAEVAAWAVRTGVAVSSDSVA
jgi:DNA-binding CsgD family transcriptional regulator